MAITAVLTLNDLAKDQMARSLTSMARANMDVVVPVAAAMAAAAAVVALTEVQVQMDLTTMGLVPIAALIAVVADSEDFPSAAQGHVEATTQEDHQDEWVWEDSTSVPC